MDPMLSLLPWSTGLLSQAAPTVDTAFVISVLLRVLHIFAAIILVGGIFYQRTILAGNAEKGFGERRNLWARWVGIATFLLIGTGLYNFMNTIQQAKADGNPLPSSYHMLFGFKFLLALVVMFLAAILAGKTAAAEKFRQNMPKWLDLAWMASLAIIVLAALLRAIH